MLHGWLLLVLSLPPRPSSLRVRAWRRLRGLGAVPLRSSSYLLPNSPDRYEQLQWLAQEIHRDGGEATPETLLRRTGRRDRKLAILAEIVHEADIKDQKFAREEARGFDLALRALLSVIKDDHDALAHGMTLFDGLYATIGERA
jgi:hypothetical protein